MIKSQIKHIQPKRGHQIDRYEGQINFSSKLRHGKGIYHYKNNFFTYEGDYKFGIKQGNGILKMKDGTRLQGQFHQNEINGLVVINYANGSKYQGMMKMGCKNGYGIYQCEFQQYIGQWKQNKKHGKGSYLNLSTNRSIEGNWFEGKLHGYCEIKEWNYTYKGQYYQGQKQGKAIQINLWQQNKTQQSIYPKYNKYIYTGNFKNNKFSGNGIYQSKNNNNYCYQGQFQNGITKLYPNKMILLLNDKNNNQEKNNNMNQKKIINEYFEYELETEAINLYINCVYQGIEQLDEIQPTQQEIQKMIKNWQNQNKKNKNAIMPNFTKPRMKKPELIIVKQQSGRLIILKLYDETNKIMKLDYREQIRIKRIENQKIREQILKKNEEQNTNNNKKGGKKDNKNELELKINIYNNNNNINQKNEQIILENIKGQAIMQNFQLPDDFPIGKYKLCIETKIDDFGAINSLEIQILVKNKQSIKKK